MKKIFSRFFYKIGYCAALVLAFIGLGVLLVEEPEFEHDNYAKVLYSAKGEALLGGIVAPDEQWRFAPINYQQLSPKYVQAVIHFEDKRYFSHLGVDPLAIVRAIQLNIKHRRVFSGASTITMQVARLLKKNQPRTLKNKCVEILLALKLTAKYSKEEIFAMYASHAPFGSNVVGIDAASWRYFSRPISDLTWAESALMAVLPNSPSLIHLGKSRNLLENKRNRLLKTLLDKAVISSEQYRLALLEPIPEKPKPLPQMASHLLHSLIQEHPEQYRFISTIDAQIQQHVLQVSKIQAAKLEEELVSNHAIVVIDNFTQQVLAYLGNNTINSNVDVSAPHVDIARRPRSTGSTLKPFLYAAMLDEGQITPKSLVLDVPTYIDGYTPENYDNRYRGAVPAKQALSRSLNIPAVRMLQQYGIVKFYDVLNSLNLSHLFRKPNDYGLTLILGGAEATLLDLTKAYAASAYVVNNRTTKVPQHALTEAEAITYTDYPISVGASWLMTQALKEVIRPEDFQEKAEYKARLHIAWKTGTSYGLKDAWSIGTSPRYTVGVWAGNANGQSSPNLSGLNSAAPIMFSVFDALVDYSEFSKPAEQLKLINICKNDGFLVAAMCDAEQVEIPKYANFNHVSQFHEKIFVNNNNERVQLDCVKSAANNAIKPKSFFSLPPIVSNYWSHYHINYQRMPKWSPSCQHHAAQTASHNQVMQFEYPSATTNIYIPIDLNSKQQEIVFTLKHKDAHAQVFWHLDKHYKQTTTEIHTFSFKALPGTHTVTVVDENGYSIARNFTIVNKTSNLNANQIIESACQ